ncbi:MAG: glycosyltransferase family 4 protein [Nitrososphaeria archaeon]
MFKYHLPNVVFTGFIKELAPFLDISDVCIAPLRVGAEVKTKILTYMIYGKPIVTTPIGIQGISVDKNGFDNCDGLGSIYRYFTESA